MFKKPATWLVLLAFLGSLAGCTGDSVTITTPTSEGSPVIKNINPLQADELIKTNKDNTNFVILDVRTPSEYIEGHLKNSVNPPILRTRLIISIKIKPTWYTAEPPTAAPQPLK
jgi:hypothetical protein